MSALTVELPDSLAAKARQVAAEKNLTMDALVAIALAQSLSRLVVDPYLEERAAHSTGKGLEAFLAGSAAAEPDDADRLPGGCQPKK